jgi:hypothetical protein
MWVGGLANEAQTLGITSWQALELAVTPEGSGSLPWPNCRVWYPSFQVVGL